MKFAVSPNINHLWANIMVEELIRNGVGTFCISPGSRSTPLAVAVAQNPKAKRFIHFDERGNAFRALGIVSAGRRPCAIITTSGTAAANLFPAVVEASKKKLPLIILTADRPPELRFTGSHQTIDQVKMYGDYVRWHFDWPCPTTDIALEFILTTIDQAVFRATGNPAGPVHLNCMYREPLAPVKTRTPWASYLKSTDTWQKSQTPYTQHIAVEPRLAGSELENIASQIKQIKFGIIIVGKLSGAKEQRSVLKLAEKLNWPVFPDISSGLRLGQPHKNIISYFDQILLSKQFKKKYQPDGVLHLGGRITSQRWYEYIQDVTPARYIMALNHPLRNDPLHNVTLRIASPIGPLCDALAKKWKKTAGAPLLKELQELNRVIHQEMSAFLNLAADLSEPHAARLITEWMPLNAALFVSNSMPIRDINMYATSEGNPIIFSANRGASGIDGIIASAIGFSIGSGKQTTLLIGDLAFLHDINSLAMLRDLPHPMVIVVLNNNGGGIFSFLMVKDSCKDFEEIFATPHHLTFSASADLFDLNYARPETGKEFLDAYQTALKAKTSTMIEVTTDRAYNLEVHRQLEKRMKAAIRLRLKSCAKI